MPVQIKVTSDSRAARQDLRKVEDSLNAVRDSAASINKAIGGAMLALGSTLATLPFLALGKGAVETAANFETLNARLVTVTGSADKAAAAFESVKKLVAETPFEVKTLTDSYARLAATGNKLFKTQSDIESAIVAISDAVSAVGGGDVEMKQVTVAFERMSSEGRITAERLNQITDAGIPLTKIADKLGMTMGQLRAESEKGTFSFEKFYKAFNLVAKSADGFAGAAARQNNTLKGATSNFNDSVSILGDNLVRLSGISQLLTRSIQRNTAVINEFGKGIEVSVRSTLDNLVIFKSDAAYILDEVKSMFTQFGRIVVNLTPKFNIKDSVIYKMIARTMGNIRMAISPIFSLNTESIANFIRNLTAKFSDIADRTTPISFKVKLPTIDLKKFIPGLDDVKAIVFKFGTFIKNVFFSMWDEIVGHSTWPDLILGVIEWSSRLEAGVKPYFDSFYKYVSGVFEKLKGYSDTFNFSIKSKIEVSIPDSTNRIKSFFDKVADYIKATAAEVKKTDSYEKIASRVSDTSGKLLESVKGLNRIDFAAASVFLGSMNAMFSSGILGRIAGAVSASVGGATIAHDSSKIDLAGFTDKFKQAIDGGLHHLRVGMIAVGDALAIILLAAMSKAFRRIALTVLAVKLAVNMQDVFSSEATISAVTTFGEFIGRVIRDAITNEGEQGILALVDKLTKLTAKFGKGILAGAGVSTTSEGGGLLTGILVGTLGFAALTGNLKKVAMLVWDLSKVIGPLLIGKAITEGAAAGTRTVGRIETMVFGAGGAAVALSAVKGGFARLGIGIAAGMGGLAVTLAGGALGGAIAESIIRAFDVQAPIAELAIRLAAIVGGGMLMSRITAIFTSNIVAGLAAGSAWAGMTLVAAAMVAAISGALLGMNIADMLGIKDPIYRAFTVAGTAASAAFLAAFYSSEIAAAIAFIITGPGLLAALKVGLARLAIGTVFLSAVIPGASAIGVAVATFLATVAAGLSLPLLLAGAALVIGVGLLGAAIFGDVNGTGPMDKVKKFLAELGETIADFSSGLIGSIMETTMESMIVSMKAEFLKLMTWMGSQARADPLMFPNGAPANGPTNIRAFANGGRISGPGTGTSDSIPALLSNGEFIVNAAATANNRDLLERINNGTIMRFADGGSPWSGRNNGKPITATINANSDKPTKLELEYTNKDLFQTALALEGATDKLKALAEAIYSQESGKNPNVKDSNRGAVGGMQILPETFKSVADASWSIRDPLDNMRGGIRYLGQMLERAGGDMRLAAIGYYGGPGGQDKAKRGIAVSDSMNPGNPNTLVYADQVMARVNKRGYSPTKVGSEQQAADLKFQSDFNIGATTFADTVAETKRRLKEAEAARNAKPIVPPTIDLHSPYSMEGRLQGAGYDPAQYSVDGMGYDLQFAVSKLLNIQSKLYSRLVRESKSSAGVSDTTANAYSDTGRLLTEKLAKVKLTGELTDIIAKLSDEARQIGQEFSTQFANSFETSFADTLKGKLTVSGFIKTLFDKFTSQVIDTFAKSVTNTFFESSGLKGFLTNTIFGGVANIGEDLAKSMSEIFNPTKGDPMQFPFPDPVPLIPGSMGPDGKMLPSTGIADKMLGTLDNPTSGMGGLFEGLPNQGFFGINTPSMVPTTTDVGGISDKLSDAIDGVDLTGFSSSLGDMDLSGMADSLSGIFSGLLSGGGSSSGILSFLGGFATGGKVRGPGTGTSDSIPALLSNGEFVVNAKATRQFGGLLATLNNGDTPRFALGGYAGGLQSPDTYLASKDVVTSLGNSSGGQVINLSITGDISRQTKSEINKMLPSIAEGVNLHNREKGYR